jgi:undecaprenyl pyrophosphate synthase
LQQVLASKPQNRRIDLSTIQTAPLRESLHAERNRHPDLLLRLSGTRRVVTEPRPEELRGVLKLPASAGNDESQDADDACCGDGKRYLRPQMDQPQLFFVLKNKPYRNKGQEKYQQHAPSPHS